MTVYYRHSIASGLLAVNGISMQQRDPINLGLTPYLVAVGGIYVEAFVESGRISVTKH